MISNSGSRGVYVSADRGVTWTQAPIGIGNSYTWYTITMSPDGRYINAFSSYIGFVHFSSDFGASWTAVAHPCQALKTNGNYLVQSAYASTYTGQYVYASMPYEACTMRSSDYGASWSQMTSLGFLGTGTAQACSGDGSRVVVLRNGNRDVAYSTNYGVTWTTFTNLPAVSKARAMYTLIMDTTGMNIVVSDADNKVVFGTKDGGTSWSWITPAAPAITFILNYMVGSYNDARYLFTSDNLRSTMNTLPFTNPTTKPTARPTTPPSIKPTYTPSATPTVAPSVAPMAKPTTNPTFSPTLVSSAAPSTKPTFDPTASPTAAPTTSGPTQEPSVKPSALPTLQPSAEPTVQPSAVPSVDPSALPSASPSVHPTDAPTADPSVDPTVHPTMAPSADPTADPTVDPTAAPSADPTVDPSAAPTADPSTRPTLQPTTEPTVQPTASPSEAPSEVPTLHPTFAPTAAPTEVCVQWLLGKAGESCSATCNAHGRTCKAYRFEDILTEVRPVHDMV